MNIRAGAMLHPTPPEVGKVVNNIKLKAGQGYLSELPRGEMDLGNGFIVTNRQGAI